jgi:transposase
MYHEIQKLSREGHSISHIARYLVLDWRTVRFYLSLSEEDYEVFISSSERNKELSPYESFVKVKLEKHQSTSASQMHDWLKEHYDDFPVVSPKTVYNFVMWVRQKYHLPKTKQEREYFIVEEGPYGKQAQVDFGEYNMRTGQGKRKKIYFIGFVLSRSRYKFIFFSDTPFTTDKAVMAHEKAFGFFKGVPEEMVYDQDSVFLHDENGGNLILTHGFKTYVKQRGFRTWFCRKSDPESKGKVENLVKYVKQNFLYNRPYTDIDTLNSEATAWLARTANYLPNARTKCSPYSEWLNEQPQLKPFTALQLDIADQNTYLVRKDNSISYKSCMYSVPQGTCKGPDTKVAVREENGMLIIGDLQGKEICRHRKSELKGKTIVNTNHKRDNSEPIRLLIENLSGKFGDPTKANRYLEDLKKAMPRYIRDQLKLIWKCFEDHTGQTLNEALDFCEKNSIHNAQNFKSVCLSLQKDTTEKINPPIDVKTMPHAKHKAQDIKPDKSDINVYEQIMLN